MIGREWYYYFLPGAIAALLVIWLLYARLRSAASAAPAPAAAAEAPEPSAEPAQSAPAAEKPSATEQMSSAPAAPARSAGETTVARLAKGHVVVTPTEEGADGGADGGSETVEGFVTSVADMTDGPGAPKTDFRPCEVYFTDNVKTCDGNEYKYHVSYYEEKLKKIRAAVRARGGVPTGAENNLIIKYTRMIKDYAKFPNAQYCKLTMPNWQQRTADKQPPIVSRSERNKDRGPVEHWAYCWRNNGTTTPADLAKTGMLIDQVGGRPAGVTFNGNFYVRGKFDESISPAGAVKTYCHESSGAVPEYKIKTALVIRNALKGPRQTKYVRDGADSAVRDWDSDTYFREQLFRETAVTTGSREVVTAKPLVRAVRLVKTAKDPCDRVVEHYATTARAQFTAGIQLASTTLGSGDDYLAGRTTDLAPRISSYKATALTKRERIAALERELAQLRISLANNTRLRNASYGPRNQKLNEWQRCTRDPPWPDELTVNIYEHPNYQGRNTRLAPGRYYNIWANTGGYFPNDGLSALRIGKGVNVVLYEHLWFGGSGVGLNGPRNISNIWPEVARFWDNRMSSMVIDYNAFGRNFDRCAGPRAAYMSARDTTADYENRVTRDQNRINDIVREIANLWAEVNKYDREVKMMEQRYAEMREAMRSGIERLLSEAKLELMIDDDAAEKYKYLSYDESYIAEL